MAKELAPCCADEKNRVEVERRPAHNKLHPDQKGELIKQQCSVCRRNHYILEAEPIKYGVDGSGL